MARVGGELCNDRQLMPRYGSSSRTEGDSVSPYLSGVANTSVEHDQKYTEVKPRSSSQVECKAELMVECEHEKVRPIVPLSPSQS